MKKLIFLILILCSCFRLSAQYGSYQQNEAKPDIYIGIGSGLESSTGLIGVTGDFRVKNNFFIRTGAGIGSWGYKLSAGIRNEKYAGKGLGYGAYLSMATGLHDFVLQMEVASGETKDVKLDLLKGYTIVPTISYKWMMANQNRLILEAGYAVPLQTDAWRVKDGSQLSETSKGALRILQPGGISIGLIFQFAV